MAFSPVRGNIATSALQGSSSQGGPDFAPEVGGRGPDRNKTENLTYPLDVESDPHQGHYIIFEIMEQDKTKLAGHIAYETVVNAGIAVLGQTPDPVVGLSSNEGGEDHDTPVTATSAITSFAAGETSFTDANAIQVAQRATVTMPVCIALYMPPSVQVSYNANYNEQEIGIIAETANTAIRAFMGRSDEEGAMETLGRETKAAFGAAGAGAWNWLKGKLPTGVEAMFAIHSGSIITPRMELMFEGIQRRSFSFNFTFIPKSKKEAQVVYQIVHKFKYHMASNYGGFGLGGADGVREMTIPDFFNIRYMYRDGVNPHLNLIKQCVLTNAQVEYGADRYKAYEGGVPQTTKLSLNFSELEIITKDYIKQGY